MNENKKAKNKKLLVGGIFALIVAVVAIVSITLNVKNTEKGGKSFTLTISSERDSFNETINGESDEEFLGTYLRTVEGLEYSESDYGIYITGYKGMTEDMDNQYWWCIYVGDESATTGADEIPLTDGGSYSLVLTQGW